MTISPSELLASGADAIYCLDTRPVQPVTEVVSYDMTVEPVEELLVDPGSGFVLGKKPAPKGCCACGQQTTRRIVGTVWIVGGAPAETVFQAEGVFQCSRCARKALPGIAE